MGYATPSASRPGVEASPPPALHALGQNNLGAMYGTGRGVEQNDAEAVRWYRRAADQGHALAQNNLGVRYRDGRGGGAGLR